MHKRSLTERVRKVNIYYNFPSWYNSDMNTDKNIQKVTLIFFFAIGLAHIVAHLMLTNGYFIETSSAIKNILEIPFILSAAIYGFMNIKISFTTSEKDHKLGNILITIMVIILFLTLIYLNLFIPDRI